MPQPYESSKLITSKLFAVALAFLIAAGTSAVEREPYAVLGLLVTTSNLTGGLVVPTPTLPLFVLQMLFVPQVVHCESHYYNPDLSERTRFRLAAHDVEGVLSDGRYTVKFLVRTTATTEGQRRAVIAALNEWLAERR